MPRLSQPPRLHRRWEAAVGDHVIALAWAPNGKAVAAAAVSGPVAVYDAATGGVVSRPAGHRFGTTALAWSSDGKALASAGQDGRVRVWDPATGAEVHSLEGGAAWVEHLAWGGGAKLLASAAGRKLRLWDAAGALVRAYPDQPSTVAAVRWRPKSRDLAVGGYGGVAVYDPDADAPKARLEHKGPVLAVEWSPDGKLLAAGNQDATVKFWVVRKVAPLQMAGYPTKVRELAWSPDSRYLATGGGEQVTVWDCSGKGPEGTEPIVLEGHESAVSVLAYQHAGPVLASGGRDGRVVLWQPGAVKRALDQDRIDGGVSQVAWAPGDGRLAVGGESGLVAVYGV